MWSYTEFPIPTANSAPSGITVGPDGGLWFTESAVIGPIGVFYNRINRMTLDGTVTATCYWGLTSGWQPITGGPNSSVWFAASGSKIGRITAEGHLQLFPLGLNAGARGMTAGPDRGLWYTTHGNQIGRIRFERTDHDFDWNGISDILWRHTSGAIGAWRIRNAAPFVSILLGSAGADWTIAGTGSFGGDADDILWRRTDGTVAVWVLGSTSVVATGVPGTVSADWQSAGVGDFNDDGVADILWRHTSGEVAVWLMGGSFGELVLGSGILGSVGADWTIAGVGDFNDDGKADILWRHTDGRVAVWLMDGTVVSSMGMAGSAPTDWQIAGVGDFDGDRKADIVWRRTDGTVAIWLMNGASFVSAKAIGSLVDGRIARVGDFNGDGKADILIRYTNGDVGIWLMSGTTVLDALVLGNVDPSWVIQ